MFDSEARKRAWALDVAMRVHENGLNLGCLFRDAERVHKFYNGESPKAKLMELKRVKRPD